VKEYDLFLPLRYNDGSPVEPRRFQAVQRLLLEQFGGLTFFPQPNEGLWKIGTVTYRDEIVIYRVLSSNAPRARRFMRRLKEKLKRDFKQEEILIVERQARTL
jgi:hypothetical protein